MGSERIVVKTGDAPLDVAEAVAFVNRHEAGGTAVFLGTVRSPNEGERVDHLFYEMWEERVDADLREIASEVLERYRASSAYVAHRSGRVEPGEASVLVAVSAGHRGEAFDACRHLIDTLKQRAPIWKQEITADGDHWVGMPSGDKR